MFWLRFVVPLGIEYFAFTMDRLNTAVILIQPLNSWVVFVYNWKKKNNNNNQVFLYNCNINLTDSELDKMFAILLTTS